MITDVLIMTYIVMMALLIFQAEKLPQNSFKVILIGLFLTPIIGFGAWSYYQKQYQQSYE